LEEEQPSAVAVDISAEEETLPEVEAQPATLEETLPDVEEMMAEDEDRPDEEERPAQEREADPAAAPQNLQIPSWNLEERIPIAPQEWDADTPQIGVGAGRRWRGDHRSRRVGAATGCGRTPTPIPSGDKGKAMEEAGTQEEERPIHHPAKGDELRVHSGSYRGRRKADSNG
jgi:hypothetical protein